jgi:hypothetical protein
MGYDVSFEGGFDIIPSLTLAHKVHLDRFSEERHEGAGFPDYYCCWVPDELGTVLEWNGVEKFSSFEDWIRYLVKHFFEPWGYKLNGKVTWDGEDRGDFGVLVMTDNVLVAKHRGD